TGLAITGLTQGNDTAFVQTTVVDTPPTLSISGAGVFVGGTPYTLKLSSSETPGITITGWTITWGDGVVQNVTGNPSSVTHTYSAGGTGYVISANATDADGTYAAGNSQTVHNPVPTLSNVSITPIVGQDKQATLTGSINGPGDQPFTLVVNWGDG